MIMFENIIGQTEAVERLSLDFAQSSLPGSLLFAGPPVSAKLSTALELARVLSCQEKASWTCKCANCKLHRSLDHPELIIVGSKAFREELLIGKAMLSRVPGASSRYFFVRSIRKLLKRFDRVLYEGEEQRFGKVAALYSTIQENINFCLPVEVGGMANEEIEKEADKLLSHVFKLEELLAETTPVYQIRALDFWARLAPISNKKTIIIEHADTLLESSRNALLKILEEPPAHCVFILTSNRKQSIIPTILSRLRPYHFVQRNTENMNLVIERVFRDSNTEPVKLDAYINKYRSIASSALDQLAKEFIEALLSELAGKLSKAIDGNFSFKDKGLIDMTCAKLNLDNVIEKLVSLTKNFGSSDDAFSWTFTAFLDKCSEVLSSLLRQEKSGIETQRLAELFNNISKDAVIRKSTFNMQAYALSQRLAGSFINAAIRLYGF